MISGTVHRFERNNIIVDLGKTEGFLPQSEQSPRKQYKQGHRIRAYILDVRKGTRSCQVILSRTHPQLVKKLFELEVPEIYEGVVEVKSVIREPGDRTKIAVVSKDEKVDSVGACVGMKGQRVKEIVRELWGEKIDIVRWNQDIRTYITNALSPAEVISMTIDDGEKRAEVMVGDEQLSLAIGKRGQNVRLAAKLTGWRIDIKSITGLITVASLEGVGPKRADILAEAGYTTVSDLVKSNPEQIAKLPGIGPKIAKLIYQSAKTKAKLAEAKAKEAKSE